MDKVSKEIEKLFPVLKIISSKEALNELANATNEEMYLFHFNLGLFMRNNFLVPDSKLYDEFISAGIHHKDDMSVMILRLFSDYLKAKLHV